VRKKDLSFKPSRFETEGGSSKKEEMAVVKERSFNVSRSAEREHYRGASRKGIAGKSPSSGKRSTPVKEEGPVSEREEDFPHTRVALPEKEIASAKGGRGTIQEDERRIDRFR